MNVFFNGYVDATAPLRKFVWDYDNALMKMVKNEHITYFGSFQRNIPCISVYAIEKQVQEVYNNAKFKEVQVEFRGDYEFFVFLKEN